MKILIAPDKFKGSLNAAEVCDAITKGIKINKSKLEIISCPMADGGEGSIDIINNYLSLKPVELIVNDPLFRPIKSTYYFSALTAYIEMSSASGLSLLKKEEQNCMNTSSFGTGELIKDAINKGLTTINLYIGGSAIDMSEWEKNVPSIVFSWYSGMEGGNALAKIIYGDVNPSGKLPFTIARNSNDYPYFNPYTDTITYGYYHGYSLFEKYNKEIAYPFGHGLSYSNFRYENFNLTNNILEDSILFFSVDLTNVSDIGGKEILQFYVGFENSEIDRPLKLLRDFKKVYLKPGESKSINFKIISS